MNDLINMLFFLVIVLGFFIWRLNKKINHLDWRTTELMKIIKKHKNYLGS